MPAPAPRLVPVPRELELLGGRSPLSPTGTVSGPAVVERRARRVLARHLGDATVPLTLALAPELALPPEGYLLTIDAGGVGARACDEGGLHHAIATLDQLLAQYGAALPALRVRDWPALAVRGFMLDVSRDRVPTSSALVALLERMASLKMNELQLYTEHSFAYRGHEPVWRDASPLTHEEIRSLDAHAAGLGIELVPNQNSFGHMERWLRHAPYRHLAERLEGGGACLAPGEEAVAFMQGLYEELLPCFASRRVNIGCDETFELGSGRSREACEALGKGRVYLDYLLRLVAGLHGAGREVQFWGDIIAQSPELLAELPEQDLVALAWHYEAPADPAAFDAEAWAVLERFGQTPDGMRGFRTRLVPFAASGRRYRACPGTSSWNSLVGRWTNARENLRDAALAAREQGAEGVLITDWGDNGHLQPPSVSWLPLAYGAAMAWSPDESQALPDRALARNAFGSATAGDAALALGELYRKTGAQCANASPLGVALLRPLGAPLPSWVLRGEIDPARVDRVVEEIDALRAGLGDTDPDERALAQAAGLARHGAWRLQRRAGAGPDDATLRDDLCELVARQREEWLRVSRPGGLADSLARLEAADRDYGS